MPHFYVRDHENEYGPFDPEQLHEMYDAGRITAAAMASADRKKWHPIQKILNKHRRKKPASSGSMGCIWIVVSAVVLFMFGVTMYEPKPEEFDPLAKMFRELDSWVSSSFADPDAEIVGNPKYVKFNDSYIVNAQIRGRNAFGGWVVDRYEFEFTLNGDMISSKRMPGVGE